MNKEDILKDPKLMDLIIEQTEKKRGIVGNEKSKKHILLAGISTLNLEPDYTLSVIVGGPSGIGKTRLVKSVLDIFPTDKIYRRSRVTKTALEHEDDPLDGMIVFVEELSGNESSYSTKILISEHSSKLEVTVTSDGKQKTETKTLSAIGTSFITTTTRKNIDKELESRIIHINPDFSPEYRSKVYKSILERAKNSKGNIVKPLESGDSELIKVPIGDLKPYYVDIPFADELFNMDELSKLPNGFRDVEKAIGEIQAHTLLYQQQRQKIGDVLIAEQQDYLAIQDLLEDIFSQSNNDILKLENEIKDDDFTLEEIKGIYNVKNSRAYEILRDLEISGKIRKESRGKFSINKTNPSKILTFPLFPVNPGNVIDTESDVDNSTNSGDSTSNNQTQTQTQTDRIDSDNPVDLVETVEKGAQKKSKKVLVEEDTTVQDWLLKI